MGGELKVSLAAAIASVFSALAAWTVALLAVMHDRRTQRKEMYQAYMALQEPRKRFWGTLILSYKETPQEERILAAERLEDVVRLAGVPPHLKGTLSLWPNLSKLNPAQREVWRLVSNAYPLSQEPEPARILPDDMFLSSSRITKEMSAQFDRARTELAFFWDSWLSSVKVRHITKTYKRGRTEVLLLAWLEIAVAKRMGNPIEWDARIFKLAEEFDKRSASKKEI